MFGRKLGWEEPPIPILGPENLKKIGISVENPVKPGTLVCSTVLQDQPRAGKNTPK